MQQLILNGLSIEEFFNKVEAILDKKLAKGAFSSQKEPIEYLSRQEVANLLKVTLPTLHEWTKVGLLKSYKIGKRVLYKQSEINDSLNYQTLKRYKRGI